LYFYNDVVVFLQSRSFYVATFPTARSGPPQEQSVDPRHAHVAWCQELSFPITSRRLHSQRTEMAMKYSSLKAYELDVIEQATRFDVALFLGAGRFARATELPTIAERAPAALRWSVQRTTAASR
jgi:hypothetical protein